MSEAELLTVRTKEGTTYKVNKALFVKMSPKIATAVQEAEEDGECVCLCVRSDEWILMCVFWAVCSVCSVLFLC